MSPTDTHGLHPALAKKKNVSHAASLQKHVSHTAPAQQKGMSHLAAAHVLKETPPTALVTWAMSGDFVLHLMAMDARWDLLPVSLVAASRYWSCVLPNRCAPYFLEVVARGQTVCLWCVELWQLESWDEGFQADWCPLLGWVVHLTAPDVNEGAPSMMS